MIIFFKKVYKITDQIPSGRVTTYGLIAECLGLKKSARMVGWALNKCNTSEIPAHRVVNRHGILSGKMYFQGINLMQQLLELEGIKVINNKILNINKIIWYPHNSMNS